MTRALWDTENGTRSVRERRSRLAADRAGEASRVGVLLMAHFKPGITLESWTETALCHSDMEFAAAAIRLLTSRGDIRIDRGGWEIRYYRGEGRAALPATWPEGSISGSRRRTEVVAQLGRIKPGRCACGCGERVGYGAAFKTGHMLAAVDLFCHVARHGLLTAPELLALAQVTEQSGRLFLQAVESGLADPIGNEPGLPS